MHNHHLGYTEEMERYRLENGYKELDVGRVILEHKERYIVLSHEQEYEAEILGQLRFNAEKRSDFPAVGDWVVFQEFNDGQAIIHAILPRINGLERKSARSEGDRQLIATNIDTAFIMVAADRDFSINRIQRYLTIVFESKIEAIVVLNKIDLIEPKECAILLQDIQGRIPDIPFITTSCEHESGIEAVQRLLEPSKTYCMLGSSGVGKSSLLNKLSGVDSMSTASISSTSERGKHTTTHRELILLHNGAMVIDNPGMREVGIPSMSTGIQEVFDRISELALNCKYGDCQHISEDGCAVIAALEEGEIAKSDYDNYLRLQKEQEHFRSSELERKQKGKALSKHIKHYYKSKNP